MTNFVDNYCEFPTLVRRPMWRIWHKLLIYFDKDVHANFMNYGYAGLNEDEHVNLIKEDETNRYCIQLYDHVVNSVELENKKILEVGSGRGGGAHYITKYYKPYKYTGVDISKSVIDFCNRHYKVNGLSFLHGKAEKLPVENTSYDAVVNIESARCYTNIKTFFQEVYRVLTPKGHFLFADMIEQKDIDTVRKDLMASGFNILKEREITKNVAKGLELDSARREKLIRKKVPGFLQSLFEKFAGTRGSTRFESFTNGKFQYWSFVLVKN